MTNFIQDLFTKFFTFIFYNIPKDNVWDMLAYIIFISFIIEIGIIFLRKSAKNIIRKIIY